MLYIPHLRFHNINVYVTIVCLVQWGWSKEHERD